MKDNSPIPSEYYDQTTEDPAGYRDKRGEWRPENPVVYAPVFDWPTTRKRFLAWVPGYFYPWNLFWFAITMATWLHFQPSLETCKTFHWTWIAQMFGRNLVLLWLVYGGWHLYLYTFRGRGHKGKYSPRWQNTHGATFLLGNQVYDNIFWTCVSGGMTWTAYEVVTMWLYANGHLPYLDFRTSPVAFIAVLLAIPFWREFHFYWIHRLIHWKPLYDRVHYLHHYNINPGPWSGMAMHPIEHIVYFSVTLIHWIIPSHPIHFLFNAQHTALTPAAGHTGFEGDLNDQVSFGSYFHYLHHRHFDCNYGESGIPLDKWFGSFEDGSRTDSEKSEAKRTYHRYRVERIVDESSEVKSFYFKRADGQALESYAPGQHLMFRLPSGEGDRVALRFYTLSDFGDSGAYRISVKREAAPPDHPDAPAGQISNYLHDNLAVGDEVEARGPLGDFTPDVASCRPIALISGGIGITPILAMAKACLQRHPRRPVHLFLAFRDKERQVFKHEVAELLSRHPKLRCHTSFSELTKADCADIPGAHAGFIDLAVLKQALGRLNLDFYICGPPPMMTSLIDGLRSEGVPQTHIHTESFTQGRKGDHGSVGGEQHAVTFSRSNKVLSWDSEYTNLLEFAESNGISMEAGCMFGECGACSVMVEEGDVAYNYATATKPQDGHCLPCSCRPDSRLTIDA